jgi:zinc transport system ATP-binding protein
MNEQTIIRFEGVNFSYSTDNHVLKDINVNISPGEFACVVGPNGGGKTTFIKLILGLLTPDSGTIKVLGKAPKKSLDKIGYVPQQSKFDSNFPVSVLDVVLMGCLNKSFFWGSFNKDHKEQAYQALHEVEMEDLADRSFADLSGGQRQRTLVARAIVSNPEILLLDEPTSNIDIHGTEHFYKLFEKLNRKYTILMVSHDIGFVSNRVKSVICIRQTLQVHPVSQLTGETMQDLYGAGLCAIRHDYRCSEGGHSCPPS